MARKGIFITGTDTGVGKTYLGVQLVAALYELGIKAVPRKPVESGCHRVNGTLVPEDAQQYFEAASRTFSLEAVCPFRFEPAISPQRAARLAGRPVYLEDLASSCLNETSSDDFLVVEGAGGFYSPLCEDGLNSDLAKILELPVLLVAQDKLGCINHVLLTIEAICGQGLSTCSVILSQQEALGDEAMNNSEDLTALLDVPVFSISCHEKMDLTSGKTLSILQAIRHP